MKLSEGRPISYLMLRTQLQPRLLENCPWGINTLCSKIPCFENVSRTWRAYQKQKKKCLSINRKRMMHILIGVDRWVDYLWKPLLFKVLVFLLKFQRNVWRCDITISLLSRRGISKRRCFYIFILMSFSFKVL
jgi:hypothetical protein